MAKEMSRRTFLKQGAAAAIGLAVVPSTVLGKKFGYTAPSDKLNILGVGVGGRGASVLKGLESQNIIACALSTGNTPTTFSNVILRPRSSTTTARCTTRCSSRPMP